MAAIRPAPDELPFCLARVTLGFRRFSDQTLQAVGVKQLAPGHATVLHALTQLRDCTVNTLVAKTHLARGTLTGLMDALERDGHIRRTQNPCDGRSWIVRLTPKGRALCAKLNERHRIVLEFLSGVLSNAEAVQLAGLLEKVTQHFRRYPIPQKRPSRTRPKRKAPALSREASTRAA